jgi:ABC-type transport system involved in cytochrome c biogenesis permease component
LGSTDINHQGELHVPMFILPVPIPFSIFTESAVCDVTAKRISNCLQGNAIE